MLDWNVSLCAEDVYNLMTLLEECKKDIEYCTRLMHGLEAENKLSFPLRCFEILQEHGNGCGVFIEILDEELMK